MSGGFCSALAVQRDRLCCQPMRGAWWLSMSSNSARVAGRGTGQHVVDFARRTPEITWWPSDLNEQHLKSINAWRAHAGLSNVRPPLRIDLSDAMWCPEMHDGS